MTNKTLKNICIKAEWVAQYAEEALKNTDSRDTCIARMNEAFDDLETLMIYD